MNNQKKLYKEIKEVEEILGDKKYFMLINFVIPSVFIVGTFFVTAMLDFSKFQYSAFFNGSIALSAANLSIVGLLLAFNSDNYFDAKSIYDIKNYRRALAIWSIIILIFSLFAYIAHVIVGEGILLEDNFLKSPNLIKQIVTSFFSILLIIFAAIKVSKLFLLQNKILTKAFPSMDYDNPSDVKPNDLLIKNV